MTNLECKWSLAINFQTVGIITIQVPTNAVLVSRSRLQRRNRSSDDDTPDPKGQDKSEGE